MESQKRALLWESADFRPRNILQRRRVALINGSATHRGWCNESWENKWERERAAFLKVGEKMVLFYTYEDGWLFLWPRARSCPEKPYREFEGWHTAPSFASRLISNRQELLFPTRRALMLMRLCHSGCAVIHSIHFHGQIKAKSVKESLQRDFEKESSCDSSCDWFKVVPQRGSWEIMRITFYEYLTHWFNHRVRFAIQQE